MIVINNIELSSNPVSTGESLIIRVSASEVMAKWEDTKTSKWENFKVKTWELIKRKIF